VALILYCIVLFWLCQVYDRLGQNDVTVEHVSRELSAAYSAVAAEQVFSSSAEYDTLRLVITPWHDRILCLACCMCLTCLSLL